MFDEVIETIKGLILEAAKAADRRAVARNRAQMVATIMASNDTFSVKAALEVALDIEKGVEKEMAADLDDES